MTVKSQNALLRIGLRQAMKASLMCWSQAGSAEPAREATARATNAASKAAASNHRQ
jgi:hypothetical protein